VRRVVVALAIVLGLSISLGAYDYTGARWPGTSASYYANLDSCTPGGLVRADVLRDIQTAAFAWTDQTNANFQFVYAGTTTLTGIDPDGVNTVFCTLDPDGSGYLAETHGWVGSDGYLFDVDIWLHLGNHPYVTSDQPCTVAVFVLDIFIHELGHALALNHSTDVNATMFSPTSTCSTKERTLYSDDITAIETIYGLRVPPEPIPLPAISCFTAGIPDPLGARLSFTGKTGQASQWLTARQAEGWIFVSREAAKGTTTVAVQCGLTDLHSVQVL